MNLRNIIVFLATLVLVGAANLPYPFYNLNDDEFADLGGFEDSSLDSSLADLILSSAKDSNADHYNDIESYPYQQELPFADASVSVSKPAVQINKEVSIVKPDILRFVEAFLNWKGELITRAQALFNNNFDLIKSVVNFVLSKLYSLVAFSLKGISVLRGIIDFILNIFSGWNIGSSVLVGLDKDVHVERPHEVLW